MTLHEQTAAADSGQATLDRRHFIALDIDGTVLLEDNTPSPGVIEAIRDAEDAGHIVTLATGRGWGATGWVLADLGITPDYVVCSNGAVTMRRVGDDYERFRIETFDPSAVLAILREHLPDANYMVELGDGSRRYTEFMDDWDLHEGNSVPFEELAAEPVCRVVVVSPEHNEAEFSVMIAEMGLNQVSYAIGWTAWLDIAPKGVDKATALEKVRADLGVDTTDVIVAGDGRNDIGMFEWAIAGGGRAVAMAQGPDEVRNAASETTASVLDGGVAVLLRSLSATNR